VSRPSSKPKELCDGAVLCLKEAAALVRQTILRNRLNNALCALLIAYVHILPRNRAIQQLQQHFESDRLIVAVTAIVTIILC
jgi:hypothetical protein